MGERGSVIDAQIEYEEQVVKKLGTYIPDDRYFSSHRFIFLDVTYLDNGEVYIPDHIKGQLITNIGQ